MSLRLSNPEAIPEVSFGDIEFSEGEGEGNEANEMLELEEEEQKKEPMDKSSLKILKIINSERAEEVVDESFIVYRQCLLELAKSACSQFCTVDQYCQKPVEVQQKVIGSALHLKWVCSDGHICQEWSSQPVLNRKLHAGDLLISFAVLTSGNNFGKLALFARALKLHFPGSTTFNNIQRIYLIPSIDELWKEQQASLLSHFEGRDVVLAGDGRMDSPGHSAQYCTYSLMELDSNKIMSIVTVDKRETGKVSTVIKKLGFQRALEDLLSKNVKVAEIATDQHMQISSLMKKERPDIKHSFDVWHGAKNLGKKINAASQQEEAKAKDLQKWTSHSKKSFLACLQRS
ncbi:uncharacterized protein [Argopecten irradians]|uniref:uncharacterized protein n=1 Tax=Argopecten irradians TaxID=31199 RepID=UPI003723CEF9